jgi:hypothetical protein
MSSRLYLLFAFSVIGVVICVLLEIVSGIWFSAVIAALVLLVDRMPKGNVDFRIDRSPDSRSRNVVIENLSSDKVSNINYMFEGPLSVNGLPQELGSRERFSTRIALTFETGSEFDLTISYSLPMSLCKSKQRFRGSA